MTQDKMQMDMASQAKRDKENKENNGDNQSPENSVTQSKGDSGKNKNPTSGRKPLFRN
jgi:hypothetical protein